MYYYSLNKYLKESFGQKIYKISLNGGMSCPNRDGTIDTRGCIFCSKGGSGEFSANSTLDINTQIEEAKLRIKNKTDCNKFIAYFQPFTNTYAPVDYLEKLFTQAIVNDEVAVLSIATRPDCISDEVLKLLVKLNKMKPVWIELGLQTIHKQTTEYIRRGYALDVYDNIVTQLRENGITVITHIILGLPGETHNMMLQSVYYAGQRSDGIKLQLLHILKDTDLLDDYNQGKFDVLSLESYINILCNCIQILPKNVVIHRLTGDGPKNLLVAPLWSADKKRVLNTITKVFTERNIIQGELFNEFVFEIY